MSKSKTILVTKSFLPPIEEYTAILQKAWEKNWLTNGGDLLFKLIGKLEEYLKISNLLVTTNGTIALQIAIKALELKGEIITTPFSYIATSSSIVWEGCTPVFVDIERDYWTIDSNKIEEAITSKTSAIVATHVFGNPCNIIQIKKIAKKYNLKVIYDAAHCFGVSYKGKSLYNFGDISIGSFHATKLFHTGEGGCLVTQSKRLKQKLIQLHNFGHKGQEDFYGLGINGKASEFQAAMGLAMLPYINGVIEERKRLTELYDSALNFSILQKIKLRKHTKWNYSYYPILFENEKQLLRVKKVLNKEKIFPRRYFYPSLNTVNYLKGQSMPLAESIASKILCLPLYVGLKDFEIHKITQLINKKL